MINSDLNTLKDISTFIEIQTPWSQEPGSQEPTPVKEEVKEVAAPKGKAGAKGKQEEAKAPVVVDPNESKFFPWLIYLNRSKL